eukprot:1177792-Prorocentrum_minimum.AAC.3
MPVRYSDPSKASRFPSNENPKREYPKTRSARGKGGGGNALARAVALARHSPGGAGGPSAGGAALSTSHGVVDGVHRHAAHMRAPAQVPRRPSLAQLAVRVLLVRHHADRRVAPRQHLPGAKPAAREHTLEHIPPPQASHRPK